MTKIKKLKTYKPKEIQPDVYEAREYILKEAVDKINELVEAINKKEGIH